jgi:hypothetical protein
MTQRRKRARTKWRRLISQQAKSGQSVAAFCRERGLRAPHSFAWRKRLAQAVQKFVEVKVAAAPAAVPSAGEKTKATVCIFTVRNITRRCWEG